jgi:two-component system sensor histidine kinase ChvG
MFSRLRHKFSPLTARILAVNSLPLVILAVSILYFSGYQDQLIKNEFDAMIKEAHQFGAALGEGAVVTSDDERDFLSPELAQKISQRLVDIADDLDQNLTRTRLYDVRGSQIIDTQSLFGRRSSVQRIALPPPGQMMAIRTWWQQVEAFWRKWLWSQEYPRYQESPEPSADDYAIVATALDGDDDKQVWMLQDGKLVLGVAVPIQRYKGVLGAVMMTRQGNKIEDAINDVRLDIVNLFILTLAFTVLLSLYLARTIAQPLKALATAAKGIETESGGAIKWQLSIPDFNKRRDEIGDLAVALRDMVQALGERMRAIEAFAADVAHEIKNPLTSLHSAVETAQRMTDPERQKKLMQVIADDVKRLDRLITDISQASRLEAELNRATVKPIMLQDMLQMVVDLYANHEWESHKHARVVLENLPQGIADFRIRGIETRLAQVLQNLIDNALSFTPLTGAVKISVHRFGMAVTVRIRDEGPGIPENKLAAIFDRFYSERPAGEKFGMHSGLGLSIAKQIIEAHKGRLWAENISDDKGGIKGACFTIELPLA